MTGADNYLNVAIRKITNYLDVSDRNRDGKITADNWRNFAESNNIKTNSCANGISVKDAEQLIRETLQMRDKTLHGRRDLAHEWFKGLMDKDIEAKSAEKKDAMRVDNKNIYVNKQSKFKTTLEKMIINSEQAKKNQIVSDMYKKWSTHDLNKDNKNQKPLDKDFYNKLYDVIKVLNCSAKGKVNPKYNSRTEQTMDEVIAILACESNLNPQQTDKPPFVGLFQLSHAPLIDLKKWAKENPDFYGMKTINQNISLKDFKNLSGVEQLDYLVAYIGNAKKYSHIDQKESITPAQLWAMIKVPFDGKSSNKITAKTNAINNVFKNKKVERGIS